MTADTTVFLICAGKTDYFAIFTIAVTCSSNLFSCFNGICCPTVYPHWVVFLSVKKENMDLQFGVSATIFSQHHQQKNDVCVVYRFSGLGSGLYQQKKLSAFTFYQRKLRSRFCTKPKENIVVFFAFLLGFLEAEKDRKISAVGGSCWLLSVSQHCSNVG